jgi:hypothetical protein
MVACLVRSNAGEKTRTARAGTVTVRWLTVPWSSVTKVMHLEALFKIVTREEMNGMTMLPLTSGGGGGNANSTLAFTNPMRSIKPN